MGVRQLLRPLFTRYLTTGGFLAALNDEALRGAIQPDAYRYYREALIGEFTRAGFREAYLREVVNWLADKRVYTLPTAELLACIRAPALTPLAM